jgi:signal transduction histidine kinase/ActR/RegA family two-component response regulator
VEGARRFVLSGNGKKLMDDLRDLVASMESEQNQKLERRTQEAQTRARYTTYTFVVTNLIACALLFCFAHLIIRDISARKRTEALLREQRLRAEAERTELLARETAARERAETANRTKDEFLAMVSHEIRTPLNSILGWAQLLQTGKIDSSDTERALASIERNAKSQAQILSDLLDTSRIDAGKLSLDVRPVDLKPVIEAAVETVRLAADAKSIRVQTQMSPLQCLVSGDAGRLQQVVWNLLSNAVKFTPRGGRIDVALELVGSVARITVRDTGIGIKPQFLPHVFDRFTQADSTSTRRHGGLGLGLAIVRQLVEVHGGTVRAESSGEGRGSEFSVMLPIRALAEGNEILKRQPSTLRGDQSVLHGLRILVVDDEEETRWLLRLALTQRGAQVRVCSSAEEALKAIEEWKPSVLVSDIGMPGEDGYSLIRKIRAAERDRGETLPAVALTAFAQKEDRTRALAAGFQLHVPKPVEVSELTKAIAALARRAGAA